MEFLLVLVEPLRPDHQPPTNHRLQSNRGAGQKTWKEHKSRNLHFLIVLFLPFNSQGGSVGVVCVSFLENRLPKGKRLIFTHGYYSVIKYKWEILVGTIYNLPCRRYPFKVRQKNGSRWVAEYNGWSCKNPQTLGTPSGGGETRTLGKSPESLSEEVSEEVTWICDCLPPFTFVESKMVQYLLGVSKNSRNAVSTGVSECVTNVWVKGERTFRSTPSCTLPIHRRTKLVEYKTTLTFSWLKKTLDNGLSFCQFLFDYY